MMFYNNPNSIRANQEARVRLGINERRNDRHRLIRLVRKNKHG